MAGSPFYARIKSHVLLIARAVPAGRVLPLPDIADWLDVPARHVAYILATLAPDEQMGVPWFRIVPAHGVVPAARVDVFGNSQRQLLVDEGAIIAPDGRLVSMAETRIGIDALAIDLPRQARPVDAPIATRRRRRRPG